MTNDRFSLEEVPADLLGIGLDPDTLPTRAEIAAIDRQQDTSIAVVMPQGEVAIIHLPGIGGLYVHWLLDGRGITVGMRLKLGSAAWDLGSATIDPRNPKVSITGPEILGYQAVLSAGIETSACQLFVSATLRCPWPINDTLGGKLAVRYGRPWPKLKLGGITADGITPEMAENIRNAPAKTFDQPRPGFIQNDPVTTEVVRTLLWLMDAAGYIGEVQGVAKEVQAVDADFDPGQLLVAIGISGQGGVGVGVEAALGVYLTGAGEFGWFGSTGVDVGAFVSISIGFPVYVFWTGTQGFGGVSMGINISVGDSLGPEFPLGVGATVSIFWSLNQPQSGLPTGFCLAFTIGASPFPIGGYASFGYTYVHKLKQVWGKVTGLTAAALPA